MVNPLFHNRVSKIISKTVSEIKTKARESRKSWSWCEEERAGFLTTLEEAWMPIASPFAARTSWLMMLRIMTLVCFQMKSPTPTNSGERLRP